MKPINLLDEVNAVEKLYVYEKIGRLNGNVIKLRKNKIVTGID